MSLERAYEILEIKKGSSEAEVQQAYKDMVAVWHPDRFAHSPRLRAKAEQRLKEINRAKEVLERSLRSGARSDGQAQDSLSAEAIAEGATVLVLKAWRKISKAVKDASEKREGGKG
jgi:DnaJ-class molecular chaperone